MNVSDTLPLILSPEQAAEYLGLTPQTVRVACQRGEIPAAMFCRRWRIRKADLDARFGPTATAEAAPEPVVAGEIPPSRRAGRPSTRRRRGGDES